MILPADTQRRLDAIRDVLGQEAVEDALRFMPSAEVEDLARREEQEREQAERTATALTMRETRDAIAAGRYGSDAKAKLAKEIEERGNPDSPAVLRFATALACAERKAEYYRRLNGAANHVK